VVEDGAFEGDSSVTKKNIPFGVFFADGYIETVEGMKKMRFFLVKEGLDRQWVWMKRL
jgi:hypothetical protein